MTLTIAYTGLFIGLVLLCVCLYFVCTGLNSAVKSAHKELAELKKAVAQLERYVDKELDGLEREVSDVLERMEKADLLIGAQIEREKASAQSERLFQEGLSSIMNYDYSVALGKRSDNG